MIYYSYFNCPKPLAHKLFFLFFNIIICIIVTSGCSPEQGCALHFSLCGLSVISLRGHTCTSCNFPVQHSYSYTWIHGNSQYLFTWMLHNINVSLKRLIWGVHIVNCWGSDFFPPFILQTIAFNIPLGISVWLPFLHHTEVSWVGFLCEERRMGLPEAHLWPNQLFGLVFWDRDCCRLSFSLITPTPILLCLEINSYPCGLHGEPPLPSLWTRPQLAHGIFSTWIKSWNSANETLQYQMSFATRKHEKHPCFEMWSCS